MKTKRLPQPLPSVLQAETDSLRARCNIRRSLAVVLGIYATFSTDPVTLLVPLAISLKTAISVRAIVKSGGTCCAPRRDKSRGESREYDKSAHFMGG